MSYRRAFTNNVPQTKADAAYQEIRRRILSGALPPGSVVDQERLAASLQLSTTPVREAFRRLEMEDLVVIAAHREVRIAPLSRREIDELYVVRLSLEPLAAELAAPLATPAAHRTVLAAARKRVSTPGQHRNMSRVIHRTIYTSSENTVLIKTLDTLWDRSDRYRVALFEQHGAVSVSDYHMLIAYAFSERNAPLLRDLMSEHLADTMKQLVAVMSEEVADRADPA